MPWYPWDLWSYATVCGDVPSTPMYKVNAAGCGKGKSTHNKKFITAHKDTRFLVIVPSLALADEYADYGTTIHSGNSHNVKQQVYKAIEANTRVLVITQKAFLDFESKTLLCTNRTVLQDEHLEPFNVCKWQMANHAQWLDMFVVGASDKEGWYKVTLNTARVAEFLATADMLDNKQFMQDLLATPQAIYTNKATMEMDSLLFRVVSPDIYAGADAVHIACANFMVTRQYHLWAAIYGAQFHFTHAFEPYSTPNLTLHSAEQNRNSKTFNRANTGLKDTVTAYIKSQCANPVYVDNNMYETEQGWQRVKHNCHGVNQFRDESHIAILSAINYDNLATAFLMDMGGMTALQVRHALLGEIAHQVIMRGCLRSDNANACHVYVMEADLANYLLNNIFKGSKQLPIDGTKRPERAPVLTPVQRKKATMIRKNFPLYQETPTELLMKEIIWSMTNTNGLYNKLHRENSAGGATA